MQSRKANSAEDLLWDIVIYCEHEWSYKESSKSNHHTRKPVISRARKSWQHASCNRVQWTLFIENKYHRNLSVVWTNETQSGQRDMHGLLSCALSATETSPLDGLRMCWRFQSNTDVLSFYIILILYHKSLFSKRNLMITEGSWSGGREKFDLVWVALISLINTKNSPPPTQFLYSALFLFIAVKCTCIYTKCTYTNYLPGSVIQYRTWRAGLYV